jgi:signal peptidase I
MCKKLNINEEDRCFVNKTYYHLYLNKEQTDTVTKLINNGKFVVLYSINKEQFNAIKNLPNVEGMISLIYHADYYEKKIFPQDVRFHWNRDNFGTIVIPKKGVTVMLNDSTIQLYKRIIKNYEGNDLQMENGKIFINGELSDSYTFQMDYYWMMGDNRHNSADSRYWGFVPENHIVGKASFAWLSLDKFKDFGKGKIRWKRMFRKVK